MNPDYKTHTNPVLLSFILQKFQGDVTGSNSYLTAHNY